MSLERSGDINYVILRRVDGGLSYLSDVRNTNKFRATQEPAFSLDIGAPIERATPVDLGLPVGLHRVYWTSTLNAEPRPVSPTGLLTVASEIDDAAVQRMLLGETVVVDVGAGGRMRFSLQTEPEPPVEVVEEQGVSADGEDLVFFALRDSPPWTCTVKEALNLFPITMKENLNHLTHGEVIELEGSDLFAWMQCGDQVFKTGGEAWETYQRQMEGHSD